MTSKLRLLIVLMLGAAVPQAAHAQSKAFSLSEIKERFVSTVETVADLADWVGPKPDPLPEFDYAETRRFDMQLNRSLTANLPLVNVKVSGIFKQDAIPTRAGQWVRAIGSTNTFRTCVVEDGSRGLLDLLKLVTSGLRQLDNWILFKPAKNYDLTLLNDADGRVLNMLYSTHGTVAGCPNGTKLVPNAITERPSA